MAVSSREENLLIEFVAAYSDMDYENLVPQVSEILSEVQRSRQEAEKRSAEVENAKFQARLRIKEQERNDVEAFRKNLSIAKDTHCGLVVEIKPELIKIQTMVGERWFKRSQVFPVGYRCRFMNGAYEDIYL